MPYSRLGRYEQQKQLKRLLWAVGGSLTIFLLIGLFGLKLLEGFSLVVGKLKSNPNSQSDTQSSLLLPPILDDTYEATNTATITLTGKADAKKTILIYINEEEMDTVVTSDDGIFVIPSIKLKDGTNTISAKAKDDKGTLSDLSNVLHVTLKKTGPLLELSGPGDKTSVIGEKNTVSVSGKTDDDSAVMINGRIAVVGGGGTFSYEYPLTEGSNTIKITSTDLAGNQTILERTVNYQK